MLRAGALLPTAALQGPTVSGPVGLSVAATSLGGLLSQDLRPDACLSACLSTPPQRRLDSRTPALFPERAVRGRITLASPGLPGRTHPTTRTGAVPCPRCCSPSGPSSARRCRGSSSPPRRSTRQKGTDRMCWCTPSIRTPWCGKPGCQRPTQESRELPAMGPPAVVVPLVALMLLKQRLAAPVRG